MIVIKVVLRILCFAVFLFQIIILFLFKFISIILLFLLIFLLVKFID